jgi:hypothetical protein
MKTNIFSITVTVLVFLIGLTMGKHTHPITQKPNVDESTRFSSTPLCVIAGAIRATRAGQEMVYLPGIRMVCREEDALDAFWVPLVSAKDIGEQEKVLAVMARPSTNDEGLVLFESQRAVSMSRAEIAKLLVDRFVTVHEHQKLMYRRSR